MVETVSQTEGGAVWQRNGRYLKCRVDVNGGPESKGEFAGDGGGPWTAVKGRRGKKAKKQPEGV